MIDKEKLAHALADYTSRYDAGDGKIRLKAAHILRVADLCRRIGESLELPSEDLDLAWAMGMLHDIGRFEQIRRFGSFNDATTVNHGEAGADYLFREGYIGEFLSPDLPELPMIETAIRQHNRLALSGDLSERTAMFCRILRDADKLDIFRVNHETPFSVIYDRPVEELQESTVTDEVYRCFLAEKTIDKSIRRTAADLAVSHAALIFGLEYPLSRKIAGEQGYALAILDYGCTDPETQLRLEIMRQKMKRFLAWDGKSVDRVTVARELFLEGYNCSQSVFAAFGDRYGLSREMALQLAAPLGAGVSAMREVCGAVSGMSMVCGLEEGNAVAGTGRKKASYEANRELLDAFTERWGSIVCREILQMKKQEQRQAPSERTGDYYAKRPCLRVVETAARLLVERYGDR